MWSHPTNMCFTKRVVQHILFCCPQAEKYNVPVYYTGFVLGMAPLVVTLTSSPIGYFVRTLPAAASFELLLFITRFSYYTVASSLGTQVHTACWTVLGWRLPDPLWVLHSVP